MEETKNVKITPRRLARQVAKHQLDRSHVTGYNKERTGIGGNKMPSAFARNWRNLAQQAAGMIAPRKKRGRK